MLSKRPVHTIYIDTNPTILKNKTDRSRYSYLASTRKNQIAAANKRKKYCILREKKKVNRCEPFSTGLDKLYGRVLNLSFEDATVQ